ncbi:MAG: chloride channel protein [Flavobacteriales bacterium]|jgi:H+/Cl- antiporter ClcA|nr:chloride channel protein [Flavobacteriales bacterium]
MRLLQFHNFKNFKDILGFLLMILLIGFSVGSASAVLLLALEWAFEVRSQNFWLVALLPLGGLLSGILYFYGSKESEKGNNLIIDQFFDPTKRLPWLMAPLVLVGTTITHVFGGSVGREGSAVQMGGVISDWLGALFKWLNPNRSLLMILGVSAGFASVFGTPLAGAIFGIEVFKRGRFQINYLLPSVLVAFVADFSCNLYPVHHAHFLVPVFDDWSFETVFWILIVSVLFGATAWLFAKLSHYFGALFKRIPLKSFWYPVIGGIIFMIPILLSGNTRYLGLGVEVIESAFIEPSLSYDFIFKLLLTTFILGAGFKGGEVTPLFFIGATLGSALSIFVPIPFALLAAMGFVAVFSGATNTPLACFLMGGELFGWQHSVFIFVAVYIAFFVSGKASIYSSQRI